MARQLRIKSKSHPSLVVHRTPFRDSKLVYIACANKMHSYSLDKSRIVYIGTTKKGARRIASSAAKKGDEILSRYGMKYLEFYVVTCDKVQGVETWKKLERALIIRFREKFGKVPMANNSYKYAKWRDEKKYFSELKLDKVIDQFS